LGSDVASLNPRGVIGRFETPHGKHGSPQPSRTGSIVSAAQSVASKSTRFAPDEESSVRAFEIAFHSLCCAPSQLGLIFFIIAHLFSA
jgi:hypothetical protein